MYRATASITPSRATPVSKIPATINTVHPNRFAGSNIPCDIGMSRPMVERDLRCRRLRSVLTTTPVANAILDFDQASGCSVVRDAIAYSPGWMRHQERALRALGRLVRFRTLRSAPAPSA